MAPLYGLMFVWCDKHPALADLLNPALAGLLAGPVWRPADSRALDLPLKPTPPGEAPPDSSGHWRQQGVARPSRPPSAPEQEVEFVRFKDIDQSSFVTNEYSTFLRWNTFKATGVFQVD